MGSDPQITLVSTTDPVEAVQAALGIKPDEAAAAAAKPAESEAVKPIEAGPATGVGAPEAPPVVEPVAAAESGKAVAGTPPKEAPKAKTAKDGLQARIDELVKQRDTARGTSAAGEAEIEALRAKVKELAIGQAPAHVVASTTAAAEATEAPKPKIEDFPDYDAFVEALVDWKSTKVAVEKVKTMLDEARSHGEASRRQQQVIALVHAHETRLKQARESYDDYDDVVGRDGLIISNTMRDGIMTSDIGPDVAYYLGLPDHAEKREALTAMGDNRLAERAFGRLEAEVQAWKASRGAGGTAPPVSGATTTSAAAAAPAVVARTAAPVAAAAVTKAPDPLTPVQGTRVVSTVRPDQMTYPEYKAWREAQKRQASGT